MGKLVQLRRGDRRSRGHALFLAVFGSMQVVDTVLWWSEIHGPGGGGGGLATCDLTNRVVGLYKSNPVVTHSF